MLTDFVSILPSVLGREANGFRNDAAFFQMARDGTVTALHQADRRTVGYRAQMVIISVVFRAAGQSGTICIATPCVVSGAAIPEHWAHSQNALPVQRFVSAAPAAVLLQASTLSIAMTGFTLADLC